MRTPIWSTEAIVFHSQISMNGTFIATVLEHSRPPDSLSRLSPDEQELLLRLLSKAFGPNKLIRDALTVGPRARG
jgi:hypothetical protein